MIIKASTQRLTIIIGSFFLMVGIIYVVISLILPTYRDVQLLRAERDNKISLLQSQQDAEKKIGELVKQYASLAGVQKDLSIMLPLGSRTPILMNQIQGIVKNNGILLDSLSFQYLPIRKSNSEIKRSIGTVRVTILCNGPYQNFKALLSQLETNVRIIDISSFSVDGGAVSQRDSLSYNVVVDSYYQEL